MAIFFTSDTHFSHKNSLRYCGRPFWNIADCDKAMIERWNAAIKPEDVVYHLGDVAMHLKPIQKILPQLQGRKILIIGNHDLQYSYFAKTRGQKFVDEMDKAYREAGFSEIHPSGRVHELPAYGTKIKVRLCHFPTKNASDYRDSKHEAAHPEDDGLLNICGHVHQAWLKRGNNLNVGVDVFDFTPVSLETILNLWKFGKAEIAAPHPWRILFWKTLHEITYQFQRLMGREKQKGHK